MQREQHNARVRDSCTHAFAAKYSQPGTPSTHSRVLRVLTAGYSEYSPAAEAGSRLIARSTSRQITLPLQAYSGYPQGYSEYSQAYPGYREHAEADHVATAFARGDHASATRQRRRCRGEPIRSVPAQMWARWGEPSRAVPAQMWARWGEPILSVPAPMWARWGEPILGRDYRDAR